MLKVYRLATICCQRKAPIAAAIQLVGTKCVSTSLLANKFHSNGYYLNYQPITIRRFAQKIPFPTSKSEPGISFTQNTTGRRVTPFGWLLLLVPLSAFGLGCWQWKRKLWKEQLIEDLKNLTKMPPMQLPENLEVLYDKEYYPVRVAGQFIHSREVFIGPRSLVRPEGGEMAGSLLSSREISNGYLVVTPFLLSDRDEIILINRGWVPRMGMDPAARSAGQVTDIVEIVGILRKSEETPHFTSEPQGNLFLCRDLPKICRLTGAKPIFLDATYSSSISGGPIGGQTKVTLRNDHLSYIITWYSLALGTLMLWRRIILKGKTI